MGTLGVEILSSKVVLGHLHFFVHFFFTFMRNLFMDHPITGGRTLISKIVAIPSTSAEAPDPADRFCFRLRFPAQEIRFS